MLCLAAEDDDGNAAQPAAPTKPGKMSKVGAPRIAHAATTPADHPTSAVTPPTTNGCITEAQRCRMFAIAKQADWSSTG